MTPRNPEPTRLAIIAAASRLLEAGGVDAVTLRAVGDEAGVSRGAAYRHFADKAALLQHLAVQTLREMAARVRDAASAAGAEGRPLLAGCIAYVRYAVEHPNHYLLIFGDIPRVSPDPTAEAAADEAMRSIGELIERTPNASIASVAVREQATILWITLHGISQLQITGHLHEPRTLDGATRLDELIELAALPFEVRGRGPEIPPRQV